ncbi:MAG: DNA/RNA nuclease SfsA [Candidatus Competibacterales bacterium]
MRYPKPLIPATLLRRYRRFLADVQLPDGREITVHCPNTGRLLGCCAPGMRVWLSHHDAKNRKYAHTWELVEVEGVMVGINTALPNRLVAESLAQGHIPPLARYCHQRREVAYGNRSRVDFVLEDDAGGVCHLEVKNVNAAVSRGIALFPDAVTARGTRHLQDLAQVVAQGGRSVIFFCVQRGDVTEVRPADAIDPVYGQTLRQVLGVGVEAMAFDTHVSPEGVWLRREVAVVCPALTDAND